MQPEAPWKPVAQILLALVVPACLVVYSPCLLSNIIVVVFVLAVAAAVFVIAYSAFWLVRNRMSPVTRTPAKVVRRRMKDWDVSIVGDTPESAVARLGMLGRNKADAWKAYSHEMAKGDVPELEIASGKDYYVTFAFQGREEEFTVPEDEYLQCTEGLEGLLVYRGEEFVRFVPQVK